MKKIMCGLALASLLSAHAFAKSETGLQGVWKGTIGNLPIQACFSTDNGFPFGAYYYLSQLKIIHLEKPEKVEAWFEEDEKKGPSLKFTQTGSDQLSGQWTGGGKSLPIALRRLKLVQDDVALPCGSDGFSGPRFTAPKIVETGAIVNGVSYKKITADVGNQFGFGISSFKLNGTNPALKKINSLLGKIIPTQAAGSDYADCAKSALSANGREGAYNISMQPVVLTANWLVARQSSDDFCGGAHPNAGSVDRVYDLQAGAEVEVAKWFLADAMKVKDGTSPQGDLRDFVVKAEVALAAEECKGAFETADYWNVALSAKGVSFAPSLSHAETACVETVDVPFATALKFMTAEGKVKLKAFQAQVTR